MYVSRPYVFHLSAKDADGLVCCIRFLLGWLFSSAFQLLSRLPQTGGHLRGSTEHKALFWSFNTSNRWKEYSLNWPISVDCVFNRTYFIFSMRTTKWPVGKCFREQIIVRGKLKAYLSLWSYLIFHHGEMFFFISMCVIHQGILTLFTGK